MRYKMKKQFFFALMVCLSSLAMAQTTVEDLKKGNYGTPEQRTKQADDMMLKGLQLTPNQVPKVHDINLKYAWRIENEVVKVKMSDWSRYKKITAIQDAKDAELKPILTQEQFKKYKKKRDEMFWEGMKAYFF
jgi:Spy/CpxP family protein refolding chaperone